MPEIPLISVVMAVFNGRATLPAAIRSLQLQTLAAWELILVDDCSTDGSGELVSQLGDSRICVIRNERNSGLAASLNRGIELARASYVARMDCDDICFPQRLEMQYGFLRAHPGVDLVGCGALEFQGQGEALSMTVAPSGHIAIMRSLGIGGTPLYHPAWCGRAEWFRHHRYDDAFPKAQDCELLVRAAASSRYANVSEVLIGYRRESFNLAKRLRSRWHVLRAYWKNLFRTRRYRDFTLSAAMTLGRLAFDLLRAPLAGSHKPCWGGGDIGNDPKAKECLAEWARLRHNLPSL